VHDGAEHARQLPKSRLVGFVETAFGNEGIDDVGFPQRNDAVTLFGRGGIARGFGWRMHHETPAGIITTIAKRFPSDIDELRQ
jgi:hypothetical protein